MEELVTKLLEDDRLTTGDKLELLNGFAEKYERMMANTIQDSSDFIKHTRELICIKNTVKSLNELLHVKE